MSILARTILHVEVRSTQIWTSNLLTTRLRHVKLVAKRNEIANRQLAKYAISN